MEVDYPLFRMKNIIGGQSSTSTRNNWFSEIFEISAYKYANNLFSILKLLLRPRTGKRAKCEMC